MDTDQARRPLLSSSSTLERRDSLDELPPTGTLPVLPTPATSSSTNNNNNNNNNVEDSSSMVNTLRCNSWTSPSAWLLQGCGILFVMLIWSLIFSKLPSLPLFAYHPLLQSLSLLLLVQSTSILQPTTTSRPRQKKSAANLHAWWNGLVLLLLTGGASIMFHLHHPSSHFISWHGILGTIAVAWIWLQALVGALMYLPLGQTCLGGEARAKRIWKWHRLSGYALLIILLLTYFTGSTQTTWTQQNASFTHRALFSLLLVVLFFAGAGRVQLGKLPRIKIDRSN